MYDYQPGTCSDGGVGCIVDVEAAVDENEDEAVKYLMFGRVEKGIPLTRLTVIPMPFGGPHPRCVRAHGKRLAHLKRDTKSL